MRKTHEILRLHYGTGLSQRQIAKALGLSKTAVAECLARAIAAGFVGPLPPTLSDRVLEERMYPAVHVITRYTPPDCAAIHQELKRKDVTLQLLWKEYCGSHGPNSYRYTQFCAHYRRFKEGLKRSLRQTHVAGEKCFTDYAGPTAPVVNAHTGEIRQAQIFVAVLGCSNYTYVEATWTQTLPDWIASHARAFAAFGGVTSVLVPDNLKAAVTTACRYEPTLNKTAVEFANHYGTVIIPARPYKPKDKAKAENAVLIVERWILARLRHHTVFTLAELNQAIHRLVADMNRRPFQKLPGCRQEAFERLDRPALKPLPVAPYELATWKIARVAIDTHIEVEGHYYSVPHPLCRQQVEVRIAHHTIEVFFQHNRVASHARCAVQGAHTTVVDHLPKAHQKHLSWTPQRLLDWGASIGPATRSVVDWQLTHKPHPEQGYRACLGLLSLARRYTPERLEAACVRAVAIPSYTRQTVLSILKKGLDRVPLITTEDDTPGTLPAHKNVRGPGYYH